MPNTKVKLQSADGTAGEALWESKSLPDEIWLDSSVGRAEDWKSSCPWFDSWSSHQEKLAVMLVFLRFKTKNFNKFLYWYYLLLIWFYGEAPINSCISKLNDRLKNINLLIHMDPQKLQLQLHLWLFMHHTVFIFWLCEIQFNGS